MFPILLFLLTKSSFSIFDEESATLTIESQDDFGNGYSSSSNILYLYVYNVDGIPMFSFDSFSKLISVEIGDSVKTIGSYAFSSCNSLETIIFGNSVETIQSYSFGWCKSLKNISLPNSLLTINNKAFYYCGSLRSINFGDSIETIGSEAFYYCDSLKSISLPNSLLTIDDEAFSFCDSLTTINIPRNVNTIGINPFLCCDELTSITISEGNGNYAVYNEEYCFLYEIKTNKIISYLLTQTQKSITIPNTIKIIGDFAFYSENSIETVNFGSVQTIGTKSFGLVRQLKTIIFGNSFETIGSSAFYNCLLLSISSLPNSLLTIGSNAFQQCISLTTINIPRNVKDIGINPFVWCDNFKSITVSEGNENYAVYEQEICFLYEIKTNKIISYPIKQTQTIITIPNTIKEIGDYAFSLNDSLETLNLNCSIKIIGSLAFYSCESLNSFVDIKNQMWLPMLLIMFQKKQKYMFQKII